MATIKTGADNVGSLALTLDERRGVVVSSLPEPVRGVVVKKMATHLITLVDLMLIALESPSPQNALKTIDESMQQLKDEIGPLQQPSSRPRGRKH